MAAFNHDIENDCILVQTDCTFNIALTVLKSLRGDDAFLLCSSKVVTIENIESNADDSRYSLRFGGGGKRSFPQRLQCFARTASPVLRMMMLESINAAKIWCPKGSGSADRNKQKMQRQTYVHPRYRDFVVAASKSATEEYYTCYDQLHPHFKIEKDFLSVQPADWWSMQNMMLIFRRDFTEVIEIGTSLQAGHRPNTHSGPGTFESNAHVRCIVRSVTNPEHDGLKFLRALKTTSGYQEECFMLAELLGHIAQRLPSQLEEEEEEDSSDEPDEPDEEQ
jgi:hypothetical protein